MHAIFHYFGTVCWLENVHHKSVFSSSGRWPIGGPGTAGKWPNFPNSDLAALSMKILYTSEQANATASGRDENSMLYNYYEFAFQDGVLTLTEVKSTMRCLGKKLSGDQNYHPTEFIRIEICSIIN
jgi:hypothetical protein